MEDFAPQLNRHIGRADLNHETDERTPVGRKVTQPAYASGPRINGTPLAILVDVIERGFGEDEDKHRIVGETMRMVKQPGWTRVKNLVTCVHLP